MLRKKVFVYAVFILSIVLVQTNIVNVIEIFGVKPNIFLVFIIVAGLTNGSSTGAVVGFIMGLIMDSYSPVPVGTFALLGMYTGVIAGISNRSFFRDNYVLTVVFTLIYTIVYETVVFLLLFSWSYMSGGIGGILMNLIYSLKNIIVIEAIYNVPFAIFLHLLSFKFLVGLDSEKKRLQYKKSY